MIAIKLFFCIFVLKIGLSKCNALFFNKNPDKWVKEVLKMPKIEYNNINELKELTDRKNCGKSLSHLGGLLLDKSDKESKLIVEGYITSNILILKIGNIKEKNISISDIKLPIETLNNKCINIRQIKNDHSTILCLDNKVLRNFWINSISDAVLCKITKTKGKLPEYNYANDKSEDKEESDKNNEINENGKNDEELKSKQNKINEEFDEEEDNEEKGLKLRIAKSKYSYPDVKINGKKLEDIKKEQSLKKISKNLDETKNVQDGKNVETTENDAGESEEEEAVVEDDAK